MVIAVTVMMYANVERVHDDIINLFYPEEWDCLEVLRVIIYVNIEWKSQQLVFRADIVCNRISGGGVFNKEQGKVF